MSSSLPASNGHGQAFPATATLEPSQAPSTQDEFGFLQQDRHVRQLVLPGSDLARQTTVSSGMKLSKCIRSSSPLGRFMKTCLGLTFTSAESLLKWKGSATKSGYSVFQLVPSIRHKTGTDFGLWPTAQNRDHKGTTQQFCKGPIDALPNSLKASLWPTACESQPGQGNPNDAKRGKKLDWSLKAALWPTAIANDHGQSNSQDAWETIGAKLKTSGLTSSTSPCPNQTEPLKFAALQYVFTAWLQGFPLEYLEAFFPK